MLNYFDDYFLPAKGWSDLKQRLNLVLTALEASLTLRPSKCVFVTRIIEFLCFRLSADGLRPSEHKTIAIQKFHTPKSV